MLCTSPDIASAEKQIGDLHDGACLSDATSPDGVVSNPIFENIDYDLLTIGNHELYLSSVAYETFSNFSSYYGDRYLTSNVQIMSPLTNQWEYIGKQYRYFTTPMGEYSAYEPRRSHLHVSQVCV